MKYTLLICAGFLLAQCTPEITDAPVDATATPSDTLRYEQETNLRNVRQLTFGGDNAEAYWSFDNSMLSFQAKNSAWGADCDQIYYMSAGGFEGDRPPLISTGRGRTTCAYFMPGDSTILYASTHPGGDACPPEPGRENGYVWPIYPDFDIFVADLEGNIVAQLTDEPGYDAEATVSPDGQKIVFTSTRSGDLELYTMDLDGSNVQQVTNGLGYDGGAFFSPDSKQLVFRASRPEGDAAEEYKRLLTEDLVRPSDMEVFVCDVDGSNLRQITKLGGANWAPYFHPSGSRILFSSNHHVRGGRQFNIFSVDTNGDDLKQHTFDQAFDAFPMFSPDGRKLAFSSNRNNGGGRSTNVFVADWVE